VCNMLVMTFVQQVRRYSLKIFPVGFENYLQKGLTYACHCSTGRSVG
jgi:hypothetical protein